MYARLGFCRSVIDYWGFVRHSVEPTPSLLNIFVATANGPRILP